MFLPPQRKRSTLRLTKICTARKVVVPPGGKVCPSSESIIIVTNGAVEPLTPRVETRSHKPSKAVRHGRYQQLQLEAEHEQTDPRGTRSRPAGTQRAGSRGRQLGNLHASIGRDPHALRISANKPFNERMPAFSRDGRWLAYASDESGRFEVYVQRLPGLGEKTNRCYVPEWLLGERRTALVRVLPHHHEEERLRTESVALHQKRSLPTLSRAERQKGVPHAKRLDPKANRKIAAESHPNLEEQIRRRAYEIYEERGREDGHDMEDWLRAEAEITGTGIKAAAA